MKSSYTSNIIITPHRKLIPEFPTVGIHEALDNSYYFNYTHHTLNGNEFVLFIDRSNNSIDYMLDFNESSSDIQFTKNSTVFSNHTFSTNLMSL